MIKEIFESFLAFNQRFIRAVQNKWLKKVQIIQFKKEFFCLGWLVLKIARKHRDKRGNATAAYRQGCSFYKVILAALPFSLFMLKAAVLYGKSEKSREKFSFIITDFEHWLSFFESSMISFAANGAGFSVLLLRQRSFRQLLFCFQMCFLDSWFVILRFAQSRQTLCGSRFRAKAPHSWCGLSRKVSFWKQWVLNHFSQACRFAAAHAPARIWKKTKKAQQKILLCLPVKWRWRESNPSYNWLQINVFKQKTNFYSPNSSPEFGCLQIQNKLTEWSWFPKEKVLNWETINMFSGLNVTPFLMNCDLSKTTFITVVWKSFLQGKLLWIIISVSTSCAILNRWDKSILLPVNHLANAACSCL